MSTVLHATWTTPLNPTMFQYSSNVRTSGGPSSFLTNGTWMVRKEWLQWHDRYAVWIPNKLILSYNPFMQNVSRYCIDGSRMEPPMILSIMHPKSWAGTPLASLVSYGLMAQRAQARPQSPSHSANYAWLHSGLLEAFLLATCPTTKQRRISIPHDFFRALPRHP